MTHRIDIILTVLKLVILLIGGIYVGIWVTMSIKFFLKGIRRKHLKRYRNKCEEAARYNKYWKAASNHYELTYDKLLWERENHENIQAVLKAEIEQREDIIRMQREALAAAENRIDWNTLEKSISLGNAERKDTDESSKDQN